MLIRLSLAGKRVGDEGAKLLAPALPTVRRVDLRQNNIGNAGVVAIAAALRMAAAAATTATAVTPATAAAGASITAKTEDVDSGKQCLFVLESLSLAGNRVEDTGGEALCEVMEGFRHKNDRQGKGDEGRTLGKGLIFRWLSMAENPGMSELVRRRLLSAGSSKRCLPNIPPAVIIV